MEEKKKEKNEEKQITARDYKIVFDYLYVLFNNAYIFNLKIELFEKEKDKYHIKLSNESGNYRYDMYLEIKYDIVKCKYTFINGKETNHAELQNVLIANDNDNSVITVLNIENGVPQNKSILNIKNYKFESGSEKQIEKTNCLILKLSK